MWVLLAVLGQSAPASQESRQADQASLARIAGGDQHALAELLRPSRAARLLACAPHSPGARRCRGRRAGGVRAGLAPGRTLRSRPRRRRGMDADARAEPGHRSAAGTACAARDRGGVRRRREPRGPAATQDLDLLSAEQVERLRRALEQLPEPQRVALDLAYTKG